MGRAPCCDKANVKKGPWSPEEDDKLKSYIGKHGTPGNWIALPQRIGLKRCGKSCRLRWLNYLRPNIKHGGFTESEDNLICTLYASIGSRWSIIAAQLPGRTDNDIKNYWNTRLKKRLFGKQQTRRRNSGGGFPLNSPPEKLSLLGGYWSGDRLHDPSSNSLTNISLMPQIEADDISYDHHAQVINQGKIFEAQYQQPYDGMYGSMAQPLDGVDVDGLSAIDVVNSSIISSSSLENTSSGYFTNYEVCYQEMQQYWTLFDESRLLSYSQKHIT